MNKKATIFLVLIILVSSMIMSCNRKSQNMITTQTVYPITSGGIPDPLDNDYFSITTGPDGNLWFIEGNGNKLGKITPEDGEITEYHVPTF